MRQDKIMIIMGCAVLCLSSAFLSGCATIFGQGGYQKIQVDTVPDQADITVKDVRKDQNVFVGKTPTTLDLKKSAGFFKGNSYEVVISKPGYKEVFIRVKPRANGWYLAGNLVFGGLIGWLIVDPATGAMWTLTPKSISENLQGDQTRGLFNTSKDGFRIVLLQDVPETLRPVMVQVHP